MYYVEADHQGSTALKGHCDALAINSRLNYLFSGLFGIVYFILINENF